ncbi:MAG: phosphatase PAP2 family protein [Solirubrobacterales bacterium]|nr:phosphatase PAP2 family protein [Solirubrobacterales bacterium]
MPVRLRALSSRVFPHGPLDVVRQVVLFAAAYWLYRYTRGWVDDPQGATVAFENARNLISIEQATGLFIEPNVHAWTGGWQVAMDVASWIYINAQSTIILAALVFIYVFHNDRFYFVRNMFVVAMAIAIVGYVVYPTAPPRFFPEWGFQDAVAGFTGVNHDDVEVNALFNPYAAVPSMHCCNAILIGWSLAQMCKWRAAKIWWALYPFVMVWVVVATANHWTLDAVLGAATAAVSFYAARWLARARPDAWAFTPVKATA